MDKLWLIIKREYFIRVRKKSFILVTILMPLGFAAIAIGSGLITAMGSKTQEKILVKDDSGIFEGSKTGKDNLLFTFSSLDYQTLQGSYTENGYSLLVYIPPFDDLSQKTHQASYHSVKNPGIMILERIESAISRAFREYKIEKSNINRDLSASFTPSIKLESTVESETGIQSSGKLAAILGTVLGTVMGILMYTVILIYGQMVMRSVMEEKVNRIVEIMSSSVKPGQLMLGNIIGVGAVGLTQLAIWIILIPVILSIVPLFLPGVDPQGIQDMTGVTSSIPPGATDDFNFNLLVSEFFNLNWLLIIPCFIFFFLGGYFIYSSLFAAIGSAVNEDLGEAQQFMFPVMIPVILASVIMISSIENPNSSLSVFGSIFPLFSPIIMPARLPFDPPAWEIATSILLLIATTLFFIWFSARIYRVGILMYGKKVTFRELWKWMFYKV